MPDVSAYIKINDKKSWKDLEVKHDESDSICSKGVFRYGMFILAWVLVGLFLFYITRLVKGTCNREGFMEEWQYYKALHGKNYSQLEDDVRICIYIANKMNIENHNKLFQAGIKSYQKEINQFSDFTSEEMDLMRGFRPLDELLTTAALTYRDNVAYPQSFDWRPSGAVGEVKDQGLCGSCYAFSATGSLEGQHFRKTGKLVSLSEQNLVDCSTNEGNLGCRGGNMNNAFRYVVINKGIDTEESYTYEGKEGPCRFRRDGVGTTIQGYRSIMPSETALQAAVVDVGPISVAIDVTTNFFHYKGGIFEDDDCSPYKLNHAVLVVGYGSEGDQDYWILKNSWNSTWGEGGYIRMARNKGNMCGIASMASYPLV